MHVDAEQIGGLDHIGAGQCLRQTAALPEIAAVEQHRIAGAGGVAQPVDQRFQVREAAHAAVAIRGFGKIEEGKGVGIDAAGLDAEIVEEGAADQMRRPPAHVADADIDARLAKKHRLELRVGVGDMEHAGVAEMPELVHVLGGHDGCFRGRGLRHDARYCRGGEITQEISAIQCELHISRMRRRTK